MYAQSHTETNRSTGPRLHRRNSTGFHRDERSEGSVQHYRAARADAGAASDEGLAGTDFTA